MSREMKDSGVEWIGQIPKEAEIIRLRFLTNNYKAGPFGSSLITNNLLTDGEILVYTPEHVTNKNTESGKGNLYLPEERKSSMQQFSVNPGDIIFPIVGSLGKAMYIDTSMPNGIINQRLAKFRVKEDSIYIPYFLLLFADSDIYKPYYELNSHGVAVVNVTKDMIKDFPFIVYPIEEQKQIMHFLDRKCSAIDTAIEKTKKSIEKLEEYKKAVITKAVTKGLDSDAKMKDSGVEWIGEAPETWEIIPNKHLMRKHKDLCIKYSDENILSLSMKGVYIRDPYDESGKRPTTYDGYQYVHPGDLLMCLFDIDVTPRCVGRVFDNGLTSPAYSRFVMNKTRANVDFYYYYYLSLDFDKKLLHLSKNMRSSLTEADFGSIKAPMPPLSEQKDIVDFLNDKCSAINALIIKKQEAITKWEEYKKSLIYYAVTGKIDCRNEK